MFISIKVLPDNSVMHSDIYVDRVLMTTQQWVIKLLILDFVVVAILSWQNLLISHSFEKKSTINGRVLETRNTTLQLTFASIHICTLCKIPESNQAWMAYMLYDLMIFYISDSWSHLFHLTWNLIDKKTRERYLNVFGFYLIISLNRLDNYILYSGNNNNKKSTKYNSSS